MSRSAAPIFAATSANVSGPILVSGKSKFAKVPNETTAIRCSAPGHSSREISDKTRDISTAAVILCLSGSFADPTRLILPD